MKSLLKMTMILIAALSLSHWAHADDLSDMVDENQEGKISAVEIQTKTETIAEMVKIEKEMMNLQDRIADESQGDSHGDLRDAGQMIDIVHNTITDAKKLDAEADYDRIQEALEGVKDLRNQVKALLKK